jgi:hypothetical protein
MQHPQTIAERLVEGGNKVDEGTLAQADVKRRWPTRGASRCRGKITSPRKRNWDFPSMTYAVFYARQIPLVSHGKPLTQLAQGKIPLRWRLRMAPGRRTALSNPVKSPCILYALVAKPDADSSRSALLRDTVTNPHVCSTL